MEKLLQDIEKHCMMSSAEREEVYRKSYKVARVSELWGEQEVEGWEMELIKSRDDFNYSGTAIVTLGDGMSGFGKSVEDTIDELNVTLDMINEDLELECGDLDTADVVELMVMLDMELVKYNNML